jgi:glycosyltransferase involved in cell wall biosynthesis
MNNHIVLVGMNYQQRRGSGDKNYWFHLIPLLAKGVDRITVVSIRKHDKLVETEEIHNCKLTIHYLPPAFLETPDANYRHRMFWSSGVFPSKLALIEKALNARRLSRKLREIHNQEPFGIVHLMDNFGFANRGIIKTAKSLGAAVSLSIMSYQGKSSFIYHPYIRLSLNHPEVFVIPYSPSHKNKLIEMGLRTDRVINIPWGVAPNDINMAKEEKETVKKKLDIPVGKPLFLWAGYIQQIQRADFFYAINQARKALERGLKATFFFAFKPESFESGFKELNQPEKGIHVYPTSVEQFYRLRSAADIFYSPVVNRNCILAPPLTWIEVMATGIPILTTNVPGAEEIVENDHTGFAARDENDLIEKIFLLKENFATMKHACMKKIENNYNINNSAKKYLELWFNREGQ